MIYYVSFYIYLIRFYLLYNHHVRVDIYRAYLHGHPVQLTRFIITASLPLTKFQLLSYDEKHKSEDERRGKRRKSKRGEGFILTLGSALILITMVT